MEDVRGTRASTVGSVPQGVPGTGLRGIFGRPYVDLGSLLDLSALPAIHDEICVGLAQVPTSYTGGSHRSMDIMPSGHEAEAQVDYGEVLETLDDQQFAIFRSLADDPSSFDPRAPRRYGEEQDVGLSRRQMLWLEYRHRVYFPWGVYLEMIPNDRWEDKAIPKPFSRVARTFFPKTVAFVQSLPFEVIGRCNVMGLRAHDHGTVHRDGDPEGQTEPDHFVTFCPAAGKRLYLWDPARRCRVEVDGTAYWFNDHDYHGVLADPYFRYSIRVDGVFRPEFLERVRRHAEASPPRAEPTSFVEEPS